MRRYDGYNKPNWTREYTTVETRTIPLQEGEGSTSFLLGDYGQYRVRVHTPETKQYASLNVYRYYDELSVGSECTSQSIKSFVESGQLPARRRGRPTY